MSAKWSKALWFCAAFAAGNFVWAALVPAHDFHRAFELAYFQTIAVVFYVWRVQ
jgi:hypothetical protein